MKSNDVQTTLPIWPDQNYTPNMRWDDPTFTTFSPGNAKNIKTQLHPKPPPSKLTEPKPLHLNIPTKSHDEADNLRLMTQIISWYS